MEVDMAIAYIGTAMNVATTSYWYIWQRPSMVAINPTVATPN
jgi:hypothetical protein